MLWFWQHRVHLAIIKYYERHILVMSSLRDLWYFPNVLYTIWCHEVIGTKRPISSTNKTDSWLSWNIIASCFQTSIILYIFLSDALIWFVLYIIISIIPSAVHITPFLVTSHWSLLRTHLTIWLIMHQVSSHTVLFFRVRVGRWSFWYIRTTRTLLRTSSRSWSIWFRQLQYIQYPCHEFESLKSQLDDSFLFLFIFRFDRL